MASTGTTNGKLVPELVEGHKEIVDLMAVGNFHFRRRFTEPPKSDQDSRG